MISTTTNVSFGKYLSNPNKDAYCLYNINAHLEYLVCKKIYKPVCYIWYVSMIYKL